MKEWPISVSGKPYNELGELKPNRSVFETVELYVEKTFQVEYQNIKQFTEVAEIGQTIWEEAESIAEVMKAYADAIKKKNQTIKLKPKPMEKYASNSRIRVRTRYTNDRNNEGRSKNKVGFGPIRKRK